MSRTDRFSHDSLDIYTKIFRFLKIKALKTLDFSLTFVGIIGNFSIKENSPYLSFFGRLKGRMSLIRYFINFI